MVYSFGRQRGLQLANASEITRLSWGKRLRGFIEKYRIGAVSIGIWFVLPAVPRMSSSAGAGHPRLGTKYQHSY